MIQYQGDFLEDETVYMYFNTYTSNDPSASSTITNFADTDVHIHKDGAVAQRNNAAGITVSVDFDGITGTHLIEIDTSDDTVAAFWVTGSDYMVRIEGTTVDGATINAGVGTFSIENRFNEVNVVQWLSQAVNLSTGNKPDVNIDEISDDSAAPPLLELLVENALGADNQILISTDAQDLSGSLDVNTKALGGTVQSATDLKDFADAGYDPGTNKVQGVVLVDTTTTNTDMAGTDGALLAANVNVAAGVVESNLLQMGGVVQSATDLKDFADAGYDPATNKVEGVKTVDTTTTNTDMVTEPPTAVENRAEMDSNSTELAKIGTIPALDGGAQTIGAAIAKLADDNGGADFDAGTDSLQEIRDRGDAAWTTGGGTGLTSLATGTAQAGAAGTITLTAGASATNDLFNGCRILTTGGTGAGQSRIITDYDGGTKVADIAPDWITNPGADTTYEIQAADSSLGTIQNDDQSVTDLKDFVDAGYDPGTNKVQGVVLVDTTTTNTDMVGTDSALLAANINLSGGVVESNLLQMGGVVQSATDLKDFADAGYDPGTNKVQGVVLVDTTTTNTDMVSEPPTATEIVDEWETQSQADPTGFHVNTMEWLSQAVTLSTGNKPDVNIDEISDDNAAPPLLELMVENALGADNKILISTDAQDLSGNLDVNTKTMTAGVITAAVMATDSIDADALSADAVDEIAADILVTPAQKIVTDASGFVTANLNGDLTATMKASVNTEVDTGLSDIKLDHLVAVADSDDPVDNSIMAKIAASDGDWSGFTPANEALEALRARGDAAWTTGAGGSTPSLLQNTTIATLATQTSFTLTAGSADDNAYNECIIVVTDASTSTQKAVGRIVNYTGASKTITLKEDPAIFTMAVTDIVDVIATDLTIDDVSDILTDTNELQGDWTDAGRLDAILDLIAADVVNLDGAAMRGTDGANTTVPDVSGTAASLHSTTDGKVDAIQTDLGDFSGRTNDQTLLDVLGVPDVAGKDLHTLLVTDRLDDGTFGLSALQTLLAAIPTTAMRGTDNAALASVLGALADAAADGDPTASDTVMQYAKQLINILVGTDGVVTFPAESAPGNGVSLAEVIRAIHIDVTGLNGDAMRGTDGANTVVPDAAGVAPTAVENRQEMDSNSTQLSAIVTDTGEIGAAGAGLSAVPWNAAWDAQVESECNDALVAQKLDHLVAVADADDVVDDSIMAKIAASDGDWSGFTPANEALEALRTRGDAAWTTGAGGDPPNLLQNTTIATLASQTSFTLTAGSADDNAYNECIMVVTDAVTATQKAVGRILDYTGATKTITLKEDPGIFTMAITDIVDIIATDLTIDDVSDILADTNELQGDWTDAGRLDAILDTVAADVVNIDGAAMRGTDSALLAANINLAAGVVESNLLQMSGVVQSATDLKDFADDGYDPATDKVQGVVLVDTTTTNTDMRGTDGANTTVPDAAGVAPTAVENRQEMDSNSTELAKIGTIPALDGGAQTIGAAIAKLADDNGGANFDAAIHSLEGIYTTGEANWLTATGFNVVVPDVAGTAAGLHSTTDGKVDAIQTDIGDFSGRTNDQSLLDVLGVPDVAGKDLHTLLVTDRLDDGTFGLSAIRTRGDAEWITATGFNTTTPDAAGTAAGLHTTTDALIAALNDLSAAQVNAEVDTALSDYDGPTKTEMDTAHALLATEAKQDIIDANVDTINTATALLPEAPQKNTALNDLTFLMVDEADFATPEVGLTIIGRVSKDGGAFASVAGTISEISNGIYAIDATAADMNADLLTFRFSATGAMDTFITIKTTS